MLHHHRGKNATARDVGRSDRQPSCSFLLCCSKLLRRACTSMPPQHHCRPPGPSMRPGDAVGRGWVTSSGERFSIRAVHVHVFKIIFIYYIYIYMKVMSSVDTQRRNTKLPMIVLVMRCVLCCGAAMPLLRGRHLDLHLSRASRGFRRSERVPIALGIGLRRRR